MEIEPLKARRLGLQDIGQRDRILALTGVVSSTGNQANFAWLKEILLKRPLSEMLVGLALPEDGVIASLAQVTFIHLPADKHRAMVNTVATSAKHQGKGYAFLVMEEVIRIAREYGCVKIFLTCSEKREKARDLYRRLGFIQQGDSDYFELSLLEKVEENGAP